MNMREYKALIDIPKSPPTALYPLSLLPEVPPPQLPRWRSRLGHRLIRWRFTRGLGLRLLHNRAFDSWTCSVWTARVQMPFKVQRALAHGFDELEVRSFQIDGVEVVIGGCFPLPTSRRSPFDPWELVPAGKHFRVELMEPVHCWGICFLGKVGRFEELRKDGFIR